MCADSRFAKPRSSHKKVLIVAVRKCHCGALIRGLQNLGSSRKGDGFILFAQRKKHEKRLLRRELQGSANLESAHRSDIFAPQQLKPFKEDSRFCKPRNSALKQQLRTSPIKSFRRPWRHYPCCCRNKAWRSAPLSAASPSLKLSIAWKVCPCRDGTLRVLFSPPLAALSAAKPQKSRTE